MIVIPYVQGKLHEETQAWIAKQRGNVAKVALQPAGLMSYPSLLESLWRYAHDFVIVEHDVVPDDLAMTHFIECPQPWCYHEYAGDDQPPGPHFGCVRFRKSLVKRHPNLGSQVAQLIANPRKDCIPWQVLAGEVTLRLTAAGHTAHRHLPDVTHHHRYPDRA